MLPPADLDRLAHTELKSLVVKQWEELAELRRLVATLHDEIARLKGGSGRPNIKPSGMDKATEPKPGPRGEGRPKGGGKTAKLAIHEEQTIKVKAPRGSRFKGYTSFIVQDLMIRSHVVRFRCERWLTPDGDTMTAPLPAGIHGHFGPQNCAASCSPNIIRGRSRCRGWWRCCGHSASSSPSARSSGC